MKPILLCAFLISGLSAHTVQAKQWQMVPAESQLEYVATYEGQAAPGEFRRFETDIDFSPQSPQSGHLNVRVDLGSADMYSADVNEAIMEKEWLDAPNVGPARFTSTEFAALGKNRFVAKGTLQIKGVKTDLDVPFTWEERGSGAVMTGSVTLDRTRFDIGTGEWASPSPIGLDVKVNFHVLLEPGN
jgi:polyisoprenoid-binding protein YceI